MSIEASSIMNHLEIARGQSAGAVGPRRDHRPIMNSRTPVLAILLSVDGPEVVVDPAGGRVSGPIERKALSL